MNKRRLLEAQAIAERIPAVMQRRGLDPAIMAWYLTQDRGLFWLFGVLDQRQIKKLEHYTRDNLLHHLSTAIGGRPVYISNHNGLRYAVLLSRPPRLPREVPFPGQQRGKVLLGQSYTGEVIAEPWTWPRIRHLLVAGITGAGKSNFLRLLVHQALADGHRLLLADLGNTTFPMLAEHPALLAPIATDEQTMLETVERALGECENRTRLFDRVPGYPDNIGEYNQIAVAEGLEPLPRILVMLDEFNAAALALGGANGPLANAVARLGWRGRKFGVNLILAAQDFNKDVVGRVRDQVDPLCFRVKNQTVARNVGCDDATRIPDTRPGLAVSLKWGPLQTFYLDKQRLIEQGQRQRSGALDAEERALVHKAVLQADGRMSIPLLVEWGMTEKPARNLLNDWEARGWVRKEPERDNARYVTDRVKALYAQGE